MLSHHDIGKRRAQSWKRCVGRRISTARQTLNPFL
jgi:hypothetical protein